jgi:hypothetical protein
MAASIPPTPAPAKGMRRDFGRNMNGRSISGNLEPKQRLTMPFFREVVVGF